MTWLEKQEALSDMLDFAGELHGNMETIVAYGDELPRMWDGYRRPENMLQGCISVTYFVCEQTHEGLLHIEGESNSSVLRGVIWFMRDLLDGVKASEVQVEQITWHKECGLMSHLTPQRQGAVMQILKRIEYAVGGNDQA